jgi:outer membrane beta-barrel protein
MSVMSFRKYLATAVCALIPLQAYGAEEQFKDYEIRVIKNKYFTKRFRLELDIGAGGVMNQSFHNSYLAQGGLGFHFSETVGLHLEGAFSFNRNKYECEELGSQSFLISPVLNEMDNFYGGYLTYTPVYGKYQLGSGDVLYFDWFFSVGGGLATNNEREGGCGDIEPIVKASGATPQVNLGTGQRYFVSTNTAVIWNLRFLMYQAAGEGKTFIADGVKNVILSLGIGYFL